MHLKAFVGEHKLPAVEFLNYKVKDNWGDMDSEVCRFRLDGNVYDAVEDPEDGYRSCLGDINCIGSFNLSNQFEDVDVLGVLNESNSQEMIIFNDRVTCKEVLVIGTDDTDDYYPYFVRAFHPENMSINIDK